MGILRLRHHLEPFAETIFLQDEKYPGQGVANVKSVVIDGPSLVYHIHHRLLSWSHTELGYPDIQPTCDEVSHGVMKFLLHLTMLGVKIDKICFDGALPPSKQETRLARLEKTRKRLQVFRASKLAIPVIPSTAKEPIAHRLGNLFLNQTLPPKFNLVPDNPFIVPAVYEDLRQRWSRENIHKAIRGTSSMSMTVDHLESFPWAKVTIMVPGEADAYCAYLAMKNGSSILTNDSDLLLYDIGSSGSVIFLNSISTGHTNPQTLIKAQRLCPNAIARRLGLTTLLPLAFELYSNPGIGIKELIQRSKILDQAPALVSDYTHFSREYQYQIPSKTLIDNIEHRYPQSLDTRVSELVSQHIFPETYLHEHSLSMYLVIPNEDPKRQCAWMHGREIRVIGYSVLNLSQPSDKRHEYIAEYVRRGERITADQITLESRSWVLAKIQSLLDLLHAVHVKTGLEIDCPFYWRTFALYTIWAQQTTSKAPKPGQLKHLLTSGYMGHKLDWDDVHIVAQIQCVLYSLRMLNQLLGLSHVSSGQTTRAATFLSHLPPLHILMKSAYEIKEEFTSGISAEEVVNRSMMLWDANVDGDCRAPEPQMSSNIAEFPRPEDQGSLHDPTAVKRTSRAKPSNIFELLSRQ
ncbi:PIN and XPG domain-containing protein [Aspergillus homomorphus CBS 101889]|uniref:Asteroid domain-containing protein n=1 Tax=Aspergillus homomorphus (strain CBS 101889) TaxID=1450537 RepID=A0A395HFN4_ASPHC|nr:hypothetical protein BO97DRAFT_358277 [Aspergillus homomorphus CBS 101889]RAL06667.1 hypothetical protein BO97DRAFT_358277 [Aspergillus homomorphus CBS 101889]